MGNQEVARKLFYRDVEWPFGQESHDFEADLLGSFRRFSQGESELSTLKILELINWYLAELSCECHVFFIFYF